MSKFIKSTLILVIGGIITKLFSFVIRIYFTRVIGTEGIGIYSLVMPTYSLLITITSLGFPIAISALVSRGNIRGKKIVFSTLPVSLILNFLLVIFVIFASKFISINLLHNEDTYYPLMALSLVLPFISIGSILRGYFFGKQQMLPHSLSNVIEQIFKLLIVLLVLPHLCKYGLIVTICGLSIVASKESKGVTILMECHPEEDNYGKHEAKANDALFGFALREFRNVGCSIIAGLVVFACKHMAIGATESIIDGDRNDKAQASHGKGIMIRVSLRNAKRLLCPFHNLDGCCWSKHSTNIDSHIEEAETAIALVGIFRSVVEFANHYLEVALEKTCTEANEQ